MIKEYRPENFSLYGKKILYIEEAFSSPSSIDAVIIHLDGGYALELCGINLRIRKYYPKTWGHKDIWDLI